MDNFAITRRRVRTYFRRTASTIGGELNHRCFFMHIPKCGGTSVTEALNATIPLHKRVGLIDANATRRATSILEANKDERLYFHDDLETGPKVYALRQSLLLTHMAWGTPMIYGHVPFNQSALDHFGKSYKFVTLMRDPIERTISNFSHSAREGLIPNDFDSYLKGPVLRTHGLTFLRYFSGRPLIAPEEEAAALDEAMRNFRTFSVVGFLDMLDTFSNKFQKVFGRKLKIYKYNAAQSKKIELRADQNEQLRDLLKAEIAFWHFAREDAL